MAATVRSITLLALGLVFVAPSAANPFINTYVPHQAASYTQTNADMVLTFSEPVQVGTGNILVKPPTGSSLSTVQIGASANDGQFSCSGLICTINPNADLTGSTPYTIEMAAGTVVATAAGNAAFAGLTGNTYQFTTEMEITAYSPAQGASNVHTTANVVLTFSEPVEAYRGHIVLKPAANAAGAIISVPAHDSQGLFQCEGAVCTLQCVAFNGTSWRYLTGNTLYTVEIPQGAIVAKGAAHAMYGGITNQYQFTTGVGITSYSPLQQATAVAASANIVLTFSEPVAVGTGNIEIEPPTGSVHSTISFTAQSSNGQLACSGAVCTINPSGAFATGTRYQLEIASGALATSSGVAFPGIGAHSGIAYSFTTLAEADGTPTIQVYVPGKGATGVEVSTNLVLTFGQEVQPNTGIISITPPAGSSHDTLTVDVTNADLIHCSGLTCTANPAADLAPNTVYTVTIPNNALRATATGNTAFPGLSGTSYEFTTGIYITTFNPAADATNVAVTAHIILTFNEQVQPGSGNIRLVPHPNGHTLAVNAAGITCNSDAAPWTCGFDPGGLAGSKRYTIELPLGAIVAAAAGNTPFAGLAGQAYQWNTGISVVRYHPLQYFLLPYMDT